MDPENIMTGITNEIESTLKAMAKAKTPEEKLMHSQTVKNLCDSLGIFLSFASDMIPYDDDGEPLPF
jgi:CMP-2-keto-3-deoxyoctulosonic acid synthetase